MHSAIEAQYKVAIYADLFLYDEFLRYTDLVLPLMVYRFQSHVRAGRSIGE